MHATRFTTLHDPRNKPSHRGCPLRSAPYSPPRHLSYWSISPHVRARHLTKTKSNGDASPESIIDQRKCELNVLRDVVDPDALYDGIDLMSLPGTLILLGVDGRT